MPEAFTKVNLAAVDDAAPANGFGDHWEARVARDALAAEHTGVTLFRLLPDDELLDVGPLDSIRVAPATARAFEAGHDGLAFLAFGPHHPGDGEPVEDTWTDR